jgi:hypothetical protein
MASFLDDGFRHELNTMMKPQANSRFLSLAVITAAGLFTASAARADFYLHQWEDQYQPLGSGYFDGEFTYYSTTENFDPDGNKFLPTGLQSYKRYEGDALASYGLFDKFSIYGRLAYGEVSLAASSHAGSSYGLMDQSVGGTYHLYQKAPTKGQTHTVSVDAQAQVDFPGYSNTSADTSSIPYLGDGTIDVTVGAFVSVPIQQTAVGFWTFRAGAGYTYRTNSYSSAIPWNLTLKFERYKAGFIVNGSVFGIQSLKTDSRGITVSGQSDLNNLSPGTGGSFMSSAINPSLVDIRAQVGYQFDGGNSVTVAFDQPIWGEDSPYGTAVSFGFQTHFGENANSQGTGRHRRNQGEEYTKSNAGFQNYALDAKVLRSNDRLNLVKIDKGSNDGVAVGEIFDVFSVSTDGTVNEAIARCEVVSVKSDEAALSVTEYFKEVWIDEGFIAKRLIQ